MLNLNINTFPVLTTPRLTLRQLVIDDALVIHQLRSDPEINCYVDREPSAKVEDAEKFIEKINSLIAARQSLYWVICLKGDDTAIGTICLWNFDSENDSVEIGYELSTRYQRKGIMAEGAKQVIEYVFTQLNAGVITAFPSADNGPSVALLQKLNFKLDEALTTELHKEMPNMLCYSLKR